MMDGWQKSKSRVSSKVSQGNLRRPVTPMARRRSVERMVPAK